MAVLNKLSAAKVKAATPGRYGDGGGLTLQVQGPHQRSWLFRFRSPVTGKEREMGLGSLDAVSISRARELATELRARVAAGTDPIEARRADCTEAAPTVTFKDAAEAYIAAHNAGWRSPKHGKQWSATLGTYAFPTIGAKPAADVSNEDVRAVLTPIWSTTPETANRLRGRIEAILDYSVARGWRAEGLNPARWRGHLARLLPGRTKVRAVKHHAALPWQEAPAFMVALGERSGMGVLALRFAILTAARSVEVRAATWREVDLAAALWIVPGARMKAGREHRVPLPDAALAVLISVAPKNLEPDALIFSGMQPGRPMSDMTLAAVLRRMGRNVTTHGFRSTFRDWAAETGQPADVAEAALAHTLGSKVQAAYQRGDLLARRRTLMTAWATYLTGNAGAGHVEE